MEEGDRGTRERGGGREVRWTETQERERRRGEKLKGWRERRGGQRRNRSAGKMRRDQRSERGMERWEITGLKERTSLLVQMNVKTVCV